jgi:hypothetical protein
VTWLVTVRMRFDDESETIKLVKELLSTVEGLTWRGRVATLKYDFGERSKFDAARPALEALHAALRPLENYNVVHYGPWPDDIRLVSEWVGEAMSA